MKGNNGMGSRIYVCIDLKSFYASVECVERGLDTMTTNLVVADPDRSEKTICLAVSPAMKALGVKNRCRVFGFPKVLIILWHSRECSFILIIRQRYMAFI